MRGNVMATEEGFVDKIRIVDELIEEFWGGTSLKYEHFIVKDGSSVRIVAEYQGDLQNYYNEYKRNLGKGKFHIKLAFQNLFQKAFDAHEKMEKSAFESLPYFACKSQLIGNVYHAYGSTPFQMFSVVYKINPQKLVCEERKRKIKKALRK